MSGRNGLGQPVAEVSGFGLRVTLPAGWDGRLYRRPPTAPGEVTTPIFHAASFPLPPLRGDFGAGAVERMTEGDVFVALLEYGPDSVGSPLFAQQSPPRAISASEFRSNALHRPIAGLAALQRFFTAAGRAFTLYVVIGSIDGAARLVRPVNQILGGLMVDTGHPGLYLVGPPAARTHSGDTTTGGSG